MKLFVFPMLSADYECAKTYTQLVKQELARISSRQ